MSTTSELLAQPIESPIGARSRAWPRAAVGFVAGLVVTLLVAGAALLAYDASYEGRVLPGVHAAGVDLSGQDAGQAAATLAGVYQAFGDGRVVLRTEVGDLSIGYREFGRRPDIDALMDTAMHEGRTGTVPERAIAVIRLALWGTTIEPRVTLDDDALRTRVAGSLSWRAMRAISATAVVGAHGVYTTAARPGRSFDVAAIQAAALDAVRRTDAPAVVEIDAPAIIVKPARGDDVALAAKVLADRMIGDVVVAVGSRTTKIRAATVRSWLRIVPSGDGTLRPVVDASAIPRSLGAFAKRVHMKAISAKFLVSKRGTVVGVQAGRNGRDLNVPATAAAIVQTLANRASGATTARIEAPVRRIAPELTTNEARKSAPLMQRLGSWKTWFPIGERNYWGANIWLPAKFIDGTVLAPGQRFEWWSAIGPVTSARGFGLGGYIAGDHTEPTGAMGGGMCSSSTTLFNAALRAGLKMGARDNHRYYINRYPLGLDATVSSAQTMSFTNDMKTPIIIRAFRIGGTTGRGWVRYEIWGVPDGRTTSISKPVVSNLQRATTETVYVDTLPAGDSEQVEYPANGMDVAVTRTVRDRNGRVIHRETYRTHYQRWDGRIEIGR